MTDREQTRRDEVPAVLLIRNCLKSAMCCAESRDLAIAHFEAFLADLEQAERERDELDRACESWKRRAVSLEQEVAARETALTQIIDLSLDEHGGLNFASRVSAIARETLTS